MTQQPISLFDFEIDMGNRVSYRAAWGRDAEQAFSQLQIDFLLVRPLEPHDVIFEQVHCYRPDVGPPLILWAEDAIA